MALRRILTIDADESNLRRKSKPVTEFNKKLFELLDDLHETLKRADGLGLAAPQVGILKRV
ncbi:MAG: peptide deformylase, partial [Clostridiales bacterium]|nr:peptide deformylase [Clostridiales bacterium]